MKPLTMSQRVSMFIEWYSPRVLVIVGFAVAFYVDLPKLGETKFNIFLSAVATVGAIMASLTGVSLTGLFALKKENIGREMEEAGAYKDLMSYVYRSVLASLLLAVVALSGFLIKECALTPYKFILFAVFFYAIGAFHRIFRLLCQVGGFYREKHN